MSTLEEIREFAETVDPDELPRDGTYRVMAARPIDGTEVISDPIEGLYHAMYVCDRIEEEKGYAGVSFHLEEVDE